MIKQCLKCRYASGIIVVIGLLWFFYTQDVIADFNGDGRADVFLVAGGKLYRYEANGRKGELDFIPEAIAANVSSVAVGNLDQDPNGKGDLIIGRAKTGSVWYEPPPLAGKSLFMVDCKFGSDVQVNGIAIGSNSGFFSDLYLIRGVDGSLTRYRSDSDNAFCSSEHQIFRGGRSITAGDLNHDGRYDLLVGKESGLHWYQSDDNRLIKKQSFLSNYCFVALSLGDLDGDEYPDIGAVVDVNETPMLKWFEVSETNPVLFEEVELKIAKNSGFTSVAMGDVDGDGKGELLATQSAGPVRWFVCKDNNLIQELAVQPFGQNAIGIAIAPSTAFDNWSEEPGKDYRLEVGEMRRIKVGTKVKKVRIRDRWVVVTNKNDLNFPQFRISPSGIYALGYGTGNHARDGWYWIISADKGKSWESRCQFEYDLPGLLSMLEMGDGRTISMSYVTRDTPDPNVKVAIVTHSTKNWEFSKSYPSIVKFPFEIEGFAFVKSMIKSGDGTKIYAVGHRAAAGAGAMLMESDDLGLTWKYKSTIAERTEEWMGRSGPSETAMVRLKNGNLLAVMRTGATTLPMADPPAKCPMAYAISTDDGATWGKPVNMQCPGVLPDIAVLNDGTVILLSGRPGVYIRFATPDGMTWSEPVFIYGGSGCANSSMQLESDGMPVIVYTESDFCGDVYSGYMNYIKMVKLQVGD